jgi:lipid II:glycine glycyltransferase (peptidoglycan interpeptide bridge formation enzyme)
MQDLRQSPEYAKYMKEIGWIVKSADSCQIFIKKFPIFSFIKIQRPEKIPFSEIDKIAKKHRAFIVKIEPRNHGNEKELRKHGYKKDKSPYLPSKTIHLDLTLSEKQLLAQMKKDARYSIRKTEQQALQIIKVSNIKQFRQAWEENWLKQKYIPSLKNLKRLQKSFGPKAVFLIAQHQKKAIAGLIILMTDKNAYYYRAFTNKIGRKKFAQYLLVWEAIKLAKKQGCKVFDFEGIYDERFPQKAWKGFSHFKKSFGGKGVEYPRSFSRRGFGFIARPHIKA